MNNNNTANTTANNNNNNNEGPIPSEVFKALAFTNITFSVEDLARVLDAHKQAIRRQDLRNIKNNTGSPSAERLTALRKNHKVYDGPFFLYTEPVGGPQRWLTVRTLEQSINRLVRMAESVAGALADLGTEAEKGPFMHLRHYIDGLLDAADELLEQHKTVTEYENWRANTFQQISDLANFAKREAS